jgi:hypothetical protein
MGNSVAAGASLSVGQSITSTNGEFALILQNDGNLVLYATGGSVSWVALWNTGTAGKQVWRAVMQNDGNFVLYAANEQTRYGQAVPVLAIQAPGSSYKMMVTLLDTNRVG